MSERLQVVEPSGLEVSGTVMAMATGQITGAGQTVSDGFSSIGMLASQTIQAGLKTVCKCMGMGNGMM